LCGNCQVNEGEFIEKALPAEVGVVPEMLEKLVSDIESDKLQNIHSLLIIKDDQLILEKYFSDFSRDELHYSASVTKSFASALLGIAIDMGFFEGDMQSVLNRSVSELFSEYEDVIASDSLKSDLKLKHMLSMTAGFEWDEHTHPYSSAWNDCHGINHSEDPMKFLFERPLISEPGSEFYYNGGLSLSLSWLIEKYTGMRVDMFAEKYLFSPMGIDEYRWERVVGGLIDTDGGLHLRPMDQIKLGYLFLNDGIWNNRQIVSQDWVRASTQVHFQNRDMPDYGYQWWGGDFYARNRTYPGYLASGHGGQKILVLPGYDLVMVLCQQVFSNPYGDLNFLAIASDYLIPSLTGDTSQSVIISTPREELTIFEGHFETQDGSEFIDVLSQEDKLVLSSSNGQRDEFYPVSASVFEARIMDLFTVQIVFETDPDSNTLSLTSDFGYSSKRFFR